MKNNNNKKIDKIIADSKESVATILKLMRESGRREILENIERVKRRKMFRNSIKGAHYEE